MNTKLKLLEDRVKQTVERLRAVTAERDRLHEELAARRERPDDPGSVAGAGRQGGWRVGEGEIVETLRQAVRELRGR